MYSLAVPAGPADGTLAPAAATKTASTSTDYYNKKLLLNTEAVVSR